MDNHSMQSQQQHHESVPGSGIGVRGALTSIIAWMSCFIRGRLKTVVWIIQPNRIGAVVFCLVIITMAYFHVFRFPQDYRLEKEIFSPLDRGNDYFSGDYFSKADYACFLPPYSGLWRIKTPLSKGARFKLGWMLEGPLRIFNEQARWVIGVKGGELVFVNKLSPRLLTLPLNEVVCIDANRFAITRVVGVGAIMQGRKTTYYSIHEKE